MTIKQKQLLAWLLLSANFLLSGCTVKAVGDPERPITINAHVTLDIQGLQNTATNIEDYVRGDATQADITKK